MLKRLFPGRLNLIFPDTDERFWSPYRVKDGTRNKLKRARQVIMKFALDLKALTTSCRGFGMLHSHIEEEEGKGDSGRHSRDGRLSSSSRHPRQGRFPSPEQREKVRRSLEEMQQMKLNLERQLLRMLGQRKCQDLLRDHVRRWDILMVATSEDQDFAYESRDAITDILKGVSIAGPWEIKLGERSLGRWERMLSCSSVVVILVSYALLKDNLLMHLCGEIMSISPKKKVIPVYLEQMKSRAFPEELRPLLLYYGIDAHHLRPTDIIKPLVRCLPKAMPFKRNLDEIDSIRKLMLRISLQPEAYL
ncbi:uncharacterized protein LOC135210917 [Macrobrachium nipponense]|uniref:uncharacterized protein LOC135210917 n=1 Tax=Macrobrachium nipponense TaxID=159736 RepID=UPI0030C813FD